MPTRYPQEFKDDVVRLVRSGVSITQAAKDMEVSTSAIQRWLQVTEIEEGTRPGVTKDEAAELRALKKRNRQLEMENEILKRAAAYFAKDALPK